MNDLRDQLLQTLFHGAEPFDVWDSNVPSDYQGWGSEHPIFDRVLKYDYPFVVEVGSWKGLSAISLAGRLQPIRKGCVLAVDTWLGSVEHWTNPAWAASLPLLYPTFLSNVVFSNLDKLILPLRLDSLNAAALLSHHGLRPDVVYLDAGHDYSSVLAVLQRWWVLLAPDGLLIIDDYHPKGSPWPEVRQAVTEFSLNWDVIPESDGGKAWFTKD